jgi:hypothetical protein
VERNLRLLSLMSRHNKKNQKKPPTAFHSKCATSLGPTHTECGRRPGRVLTQYCNRRYPEETMCLNFMLQQ